MSGAMVRLKIYECTKIIKGELSFGFRLRFLFHLFSKICYNWEDILNIIRSTLGMNRLSHLLTFQLLSVL